MSTLLDDVLAAHGGLDRWRQIRRLTLDVEIGGLLLAVKGRSPQQRSLRVRIDPHHVDAELTPFPGPGCRGLFRREGVRIETTDGAIVAERTIARDAHGAVPRRLRWSDLDLLYFFGYALWNYSVTPFVFTWQGFESREGALWRERDGATWRTLHVRFPPDVPTHCRDQVFYFDERHVLRRLDYTAVAFGAFARGAHYCEDARWFDGVLTPTTRAVYPRRRNGQPIRTLPVMRGRIRHVTAE